ncbi:follistatin-related protein 5-like [Photinus pyralis]|uniref:follistatin-related protein 5-like n=1 Tax=Photinus pyralis TaxID=7054 RepID=UPI0012673884|nr:follistatin-related protein 5-like [Photinus pyralis]
MKGHECTLTEDGEAKCVCQRQCNVHHKLVCGSDGHIYPNHCELHRAACLTNTAISIERGVHCVKHGKGWAPTLEHTNLYFNQLATTTPTNLALEDDNTTIEPSRPTEDNLITSNAEETTISSTVSTNTFSNLDAEIDNEINVDIEESKRGCSMQEYEIMKDNLLLYNHARLMSQDNHSKDYLVSIMFSHYDQNNNGNLEISELKTVSKIKMGSLMGCGKKF